MESVTYRLISIFTWLGTICCHYSVLFWFCAIVLKVVKLQVIWSWSEQNIFILVDKPISVGCQDWLTDYSQIYWILSSQKHAAYLLLRVNLDKIMHARWDFDASSARTRRVSALDKHQNWSASALFCLNSRAQSKYAVVNLIHTRRTQTFLSFIMW